MDGRLYIRDLIALEEGAGLAVSTQIDLNLHGEIGRLGGDGRMVSIHSVKDVSNPAMPTELGKQIKVYFASPTFFKKGWFPDFLDSQTLSGRFPDTSTVLKLQGALIKEVRPIGGWDLKKQQPREMRNLVGAGSVFYFKVESGDSQQFAEGIHGKCLCEDDAMSKAGFGLAYVGRY